MATVAGPWLGFIAGGPIGFQDFKGPLASLAISSIIGAAGGLSTADDTGRRYLIGVAAAVQFAIFPVWFGAATVVGLPDRAILLTRLTSFAINIVAITGAAVIAYALLGLKRGELRQFIQFPGNKR